MSTAGDVGTRDGEARQYLENHRVLELFNNLTSQLMYNRPDEPKKFMIDVLEKLQKSKITRLDYPCLFDDSNIQSVFGMLDPTNRGCIAFQQYSAALTTLGVKDFDQSPEGSAEDRVTFETFLKEARKGLSEASSTFADS
ncbi:EF-hand calcium-binding domain-containing protein 10-like [Mizuhopecten yessoensis]|uniref:EF-hand calcium-binding domain-containing protein 10 n=1 Tax=Mizuhopecten yessoensis TaxID=6573 RepID=A0A210PG79_MIZYE|nr:EF-hand calcium-binding domain-containing protein 10-like [Mizuhopecten yessoensis]OWF35504.1 EF-hand calcium-binding domain-containing protein 10 [Mizuhopecten yessoensis]